MKRLITRKVMKERGLPRMNKFAKIPPSRPSREMSSPAKKNPHIV